MNSGQFKTVHMPRGHDLDDMYTQLQCSQLELFYAKIQLHLLQLQDLHAELPAFLRQLKQCSLIEQMPEICLVMCYPFTQECFIFHALDSALAQPDIRLLQEQLLSRSAPQLELQDAEFALVQHKCRLLLMGSNCAVWRVYLNEPTDFLDSEFLQQLDAQLAHGFQQRAAQQDKIQQILQQERREFSAELHDSIAQIIGFLRLKSAQLNQQCRQQELYAPLLEQTAEIASYTHYAYQQVRELITASRLTYQELDFSTALKKIITEFEHQSSIAFGLDNRASKLKVSAKQSVQLLYIIRESLSNIVRHSHATSAVISIRQTRQQLQIHILDNGRGMHAAQKRVDSFGLDIMHERAERISAVLHIRPNRPQGTRVELSLDMMADTDK